MRRFTAFSMLLCLGLLGAGSARAAAPRNLLANPGFEQSLGKHPWMPTAWDTSRTGLDWVFFGRDTISARTGHYAVSVASVSSLIPMACNWSQTLVVGKEAWGKDLVFSIWTRSMGLEGRGYIVLQAFRDTASKMARVWNVERDEALRRLKINKIDDQAVDFGWAREYFTDRETDWVRREVRVYIPAGVNVVFVRGGLMGTGQVILDDASLTLETARPAENYPLHTNLIPDPSFEGDGSKWEYSLPPYEGLKVERDSTVAHTGKASLLIEGHVGLVKTRVGASQVFCNRDLNGKRVKATVWVKCDSLKTGVFIKIFAHTAKGVLGYPSPRQAAGTSDWQQIGLDLDVPPDTNALWVWFQAVTPAEGRFWLDDATFEVLGPATGQVHGAETGFGG